MEKGKSTSACDFTLQKEKGWGMKKAIATVLTKSTFEYEFCDIFKWGEKGGWAKGVRKKCDVI